MCKLVVAVCDTEDGYRSRFVTYLMEHKAGEFAVHAFSVPERFLEQLEEKTFDLVLLGRGFEGVKDEVKGRHILLLILEGTIPDSVAEEIYHSKEESPGTVRVFRYQSMEVILHEMQVLAAEKWMSSAAQRTTMSKMEVIGIYSPVCHEMQIPFSMVFAALMSEKQKVLYLNLMEFSGFLELFDLAGEHDFGDIVLRIRDKKLSSELFLRSVYDTCGLYYIPPFANPEDLKELTLEDYKAFLDYLETNTDFEAVILDFGHGLRQFARMLERCTSIYCPVKAGFFFECQIRQYRIWLEAEMESDVWERLHLAELPFSAKRIRGESGVLKQLQWSEFGDYVRSYLTGADYERI